MTSVRDDFNHEPNFLSLLRVRKLKFPFAFQFFLIEKLGILYSIWLIDDVQLLSWPAEDLLERVKEVSFEISFNTMFES